MGNFSAKSLAIPEVLVIAPRKFGDARGYFMETYAEPAFSEIGISCRFVQDNQSMSGLRGTVRGLHFQVPPRAQAKLVRVLRGSIFDVAVDLRRESPTFGRWCSAILTAEKGEQIFVPRGFAHGFCTLEADTEVAYKVDEVYAPDCDSGILWNDASVGVEWPVEAGAAIVSDKDAKLPLLRQVETPF